jgi:hypothetical protein
METQMKHKIAVALGAVAAALLFSMPAQAGHCSTAASAGNYGFTLTGTVIIPGVGPAPLAAVGRAKLEADGKVSGTEARSVGGEYADETFIGTFSTNSDCTGTTTINFYEAGQLVRISVLSIVVDDDNHEIRMVQKSLTLPNGDVWPVIATVDARKIEHDSED